MPPKILLFGPGAVGTIYLYLLIKSGCEVTAVCRSNYSVVSTSGFTIDSDRYGSNIHVRPTRVVRDCTEAASSSDGEKVIYDYVIVTTKALPSARTPTLISPAITPERTTIVLIQNGINIEQEYLSTLPRNPLLSCTVYLPTTEVSPGKIEMGSDERLEIGAFPSSPSSVPAEDFLKLMTSAGSNATFHPDVQARRWFKLLLNASWNPICALTLARDTAVLGEGGHDAEKVVKGVMDEVAAVAAALGYGDTLSAEAVEKQLDRARHRKGTIGIEPSMLTDVLNGRAVEVEVILGNPVRVARELGVEVPRMEMLYALLKVLDASVRGRREGEALSGEGYRSE